MGQAQSIQCSLAESHLRALTAFAVDSTQEGALDLAAAKFWENGFVMLLGVHGSEDMDALHRACHSAAPQHMAVPRMYRGLGRYSMHSAVASQQPEYVDLVKDDIHIQLLANLHGDRWGRFSVTKFGGDFNFRIPTASYWTGTQPLHTDFNACKPFTPEEGDPNDPPCMHVWQPPTIASSVACHDISELDGPFRTMTWNQMAAWGCFTNRSIPTLEDELRFQTHCPELVAHKLVMPRGSVLVRDVRVFHAGSWNKFPLRTRFLPGFLSCGFGYVHTAGYRPAREVPSELFYQWERKSNCDHSLIHYIVQS